MKKVAFYTLGCKVNFCETEALQSLFEQAGYTVTDFEDTADVYVINTCTVTNLGDHKSRKMVRRARRRSPGSVIVVTGCYAQGFPEEVAGLPPVDLVVGTRERHNLPALVEALPGDRKQAVNLVRPYAAECSFEDLPLPERRGRTRGFLKIQEGCDLRCSYCIIPLVRGPQRSLPLEEAYERARRMARAGYKEIVLTGTHLGMYGSDLNNHTSLARLLKAMEEIQGLVRIRLSSLEPTDITGELVEQMARSRKLCPYLHIPLQCGDGEVLKRMGRGYTPAEFAYLVNWLRQELPGVAIGTDVIVGFPGETEEHHRRNLAFVREMAFSRLHVFKFSPRPGTPAAGFPEQVEGKVKERRSREMIALGVDLASRFRRRFLGSTEQVLVEEVAAHEYVEGLTRHYLRVRASISSNGTGLQGKLVPVRLEKEEGDLLHGRAVKKTSSNF